MSVLKVLKIPHDRSNRKIKSPKPYKPKPVTVTELKPKKRKE